MSSFVIPFYCGSGTVTGSATVNNYGSGSATLVTMTYNRTLQIEEKKLTWKANDADEPMRVLIDRHHDKVLVEQVDLLGPLPHPIVALLCRREARIVLYRVVLVRLVLAGGSGGEPLVEVGGEDVGLGKDRLLVLVFAVLQVPVSNTTSMNRSNRRGIEAVCRPPLPPQTRLFPGEAFGINSTSALH